MRQASNRRMVLAFALPVVVVCAIVAISYRSTVSYATAIRWVALTHEVLATLEGVRSDLAKAEAAARGYALTGQPVYEAGNSIVLLRGHRTKVN
jgi:methyl-accepting chemotaxis protein